MPGEIAFDIKGKCTYHTFLRKLSIEFYATDERHCYLTKKYVDKLKGYHAKFLDTRKTTPNFRLLEKEAVRIGGGKITGLDCTI